MVPAAYQVELNPANEILPLLGSKEGIMHISMTFLQAGDEVLIPNPGYPAYRAAAQLSGATPVDYDLTAATNWQPDLDALAQRDLSRVKLMWLNYPHMPTGAPADWRFWRAWLPSRSTTTFCWCMTTRTASFSTTTRRACWRCREPGR